MLNRKYIGLAAITALIIALLVSCASVAGATTVTTGHGYHKKYTLEIPNHHRNPQLKRVSRLNHCRIVLNFGGDPYGNGVYEHFTCHHAGMRVTVDQSSTRYESRELRSISRTLGRAQWPIAYCPQSGGYAIDAAWTDDIYLKNPDPTAIEKKNFASWLEDYAAANNCSFYNTAVY